MKIELQVGTLKQALALCRAPNPMIAEIGGDEGIHLSSHGEALGIHLSLKSGLVHEPGFAAVPSATLERLVAAMPANEQVVLSRSKSENDEVSHVIRVTMGKGKWDINVLQDDEASASKREPPEESNEISSEVFAVLDAASEWAHKDVHNPLSSVQLKPADGKLAVTALDGQRLRTQSIDCEFDTELVLPRAAAQWLSQLLRSASNIKLGGTGTSIQVVGSTDAWSITAQATLRAGNFPAWEGLIDRTDGSHKITFGGTEMIEAVQRAQALLPTELTPVRIDLDEESLLVGAAQNEAGESSERIPVKWRDFQNDTGSVLGYRPDYLKHLIDEAMSLSGKSKIKATLHPRQPMIVKSGSATLVLMPYVLPGTE